MKKPKNNSWFVLIIMLTGLGLFLNGILDKDWINLVAGIFLLTNGEVTIINYDGRETY